MVKTAQSLCEYPLLTLGGSEVSSALLSRLFECVSGHSQGEQGAAGDPGMSGFPGAKVKM